MFLLAAGFCDGLLMAWDPGLQPFLPAPGCKSARVQNITGDRPLLHSTVSGKLYHAPNCITHPTSSNCTTIIDPRTNCNGLHHEKLHGPGVCREVGVNDGATVIHFHPERLETTPDLALVLFSIRPAVSFESNAITNGWNRNRVG